jgi:uncharacterized protein (DUF305 family)
MKARKSLVYVAAALMTSLSIVAFGQESGGDSKEAKSMPAKDMHSMMAKGMKEMQSMRMTGNMDRDFAMMMRHHHQQGVEMAQMEMQHGKDANMREMAQKIIDSQKKEIAEFDQWLSQHGGAKK